MAPLTPADYKNEPLASFLSAFFQGAYLPGRGGEGVGGGEQHAYRTVPAWRRSCGPMSAPEGPRPWFCLCGEHVQGKDGGDNPAHGICLAPAEPGMRRTVRRLLFPFRKSHSSKLQTQMQEVIILMVNFFSAEDRGATSGANLGLLSAGWSINTPLWTGFK